MLRKIREVAMSRQRSQSRQLTIVFTEADLWEKLPEKNRQQCRALLVELLSEVVRGEEIEDEESDDEREDSTGTP
jgi:hypothetical protein